MAINLDILNTYILMAIAEEIVPQPTFFKDRYFPTGAGDIFAADKVLTEYRKGDRKMAAFVAPRAGDIPVDRRGYEIHEFQPAYIAPSRTLTVDDLTKRGFGEALYPGTEPAARAARILLQDQIDLDLRINRREEWMVVQTMLNNACSMQEYVDAKTKGELLEVKFYDTTSDHIYTVSKPWNDPDGDFFMDVKNMCRMLSKRGLPAVDLLLGTDVADVICDIPKVRELLDNRRMEYGSLDPKLTQYEGVAVLGTLNFSGFRLSLIEVGETYVTEDGTEQAHFPADGAMVTAPNCGHLMYGQITQIDHGSTDFATHAAKRVPKLIVDQPHDIRKLRVASRPLAAPHSYCPYIYAASVVS